MSLPVRFRQVTGNIYAGAAPSDSDIDALTQRGIHYFLSLDQNVASKIAPKLLQNKIKQIVIPINTNATPDENLRYLVRNVVRILSSMQPIYVHCQLGSDRTGFALAIYRIVRQGFSVDQAIADAKKWNYGAQISPATQNLWKNILTSIAEHKTGDIAFVDDYGTSIAQETLLTLPPLANPMQSWAPYYAEPMSEDPNRKEQYLKLKDSDKGIPQPGLYSDQGIISGCGPVENQSLINCDTYL